MPGQYIDENVRPDGGNVATRRSFKILEDNNGRANDYNHKLRAKPLVKRTALGDVTNKVAAKKNHSIVIQKHKLTSHEVHLKKDRQVIHPNLITQPVEKKHHTTHLNPADSPPTLMPQEEEEIKDEEDFLSTLSKQSPMCISNDLQSMTLDHHDHDVDSCDAEDELSCYQYAEEMYRYFMEIEKHRMPAATYMSRQTDINSKMRAILVDWLVDVHSKYQMLPQTLHIGISLIDRFLDRDTQVARQRLQLVGITAMFIASKYEEIYPPEAYDFVRITDNAYSPEEVFMMEECMLTTLGYRVTVPTTYQFLERFLKVAGTVDKQTAHFSHYIIDRCLQEYKLIKYPPSTIAAAAVYIGRTQMEEMPAWHSTLEYHTTYSENSLTQCVQELKEALWSAQNRIGKSSKLTAVRRKFSKDKFLNVSLQPLAFNEN